jgi:hypothetical protein
MEETKMELQFRLYARHDSRSFTDKQQIAVFGNVDSEFMDDLINTLEGVRDCWYTYEPL